VIEKLRSLTSTQFTMFVFNLADLEGANKAEIERKIQVSLESVFDRQKPADRAKRVLKTDFQKLLALYFHQYQTQTGFAHERLAKKLDECEKVFLRHLGKDKVQYLRLLIAIAKLIQEKPKGLLVA
jgi:hypothetical protein